MLALTLHHSPHILKLKTAGVASMTNNLNNINNVLKHLYDSVNGLTECANQINLAIYKQKLLAIAEQRNIFANELKSILANENVNFDKYGSVAGPLHRIYIDLVGFFTDGDVASINKEIKRGDDMLIKSY